MNRGKGIANTPFKIFIIASILREDNDEDHEKALGDNQNDGLGTAAIHIAIYPGLEPGTS